MSGPWYVVIERLDMNDQPLPAYAVGPYRTFVGATVDRDSETSMTHALLTIDSKAEKYQAIECYVSEASDLEEPYEVIAPALEGLT